MKKFYLFVLSIVLSGISAFAQTNTQKQFVLEKQNELLHEINFEEISQPNWGMAMEGQQFLLEKSKVTQFGIRENAGIKEVYESMKKGVQNGSIPKANLKVNIFNMSIDNENIFKGIEKNGRVKDEDKFWTIPVICKIHTTVEKIVEKTNRKIASDAIFKVTFSWKVTQGKNKAELYSIKSEKYSKRSKRAMLDKIKEAAAKDSIASLIIADWQKNIVENLKKEGYVSELSVEPKIGKGELKNQIYTRTDIVTIYIPHEYKNDKDGRWLYDTNPKDHYNLDITFTVQFKNNLNMIDTMYVDYKRGDIIPAIKNKEKEERIELADSLIKKFINNLEIYAENPSEEVKSELVSMFIDTENEIIEVRKNNTEKKHTWTVNKYFHKLEFKNIKIVLKEPLYLNDSTDIIIYPFHLNYNRHCFFGFCGDDMDSKLHLKFVNETYLIEKIVLLRAPYLKINF